MLSLTKKNVRQQLYVRLIDTLDELWMRCGKRVSRRRLEEKLRRKREGKGKEIHSRRKRDTDGDVERETNKKRGKKEGKRKREKMRRGLKRDWQRGDREGAKKREG